MKNNLSKLQKLLGSKFEDSDLLTIALVHKSYAVENGSNEHNERMEFLGDSVLSIAVADFLYHKYPKQDEGKLSQLKSQLVSRQSLSRWAKEIDLGSYMFISHGEDLNGGRERDSLLSNTLEAIICAIYLESGYEAAKKFIFNYLKKQRRLVVNDSKSKLQELIQSQYQTLPEYKVLTETGPDHKKVFEIGVYLKKDLLGQGAGCSKKDAEQKAAQRALKTVRAKNK